MNEAEGRTWKMGVEKQQLRVLPSGYELSDSHYSWPEVLFSKDNFHYDLLP